MDGDGYRGKDTRPHTDAPWGDQGGAGNSQGSLPPREV